MQEAAVSLISTWENFYVIIGSSAAALKGIGVLDMLKESAIFFLGLRDSICLDRFRILEAEHTPMSSLNWTWSF
jgi:hypothetical protein